MVISLGVLLVAILSIYSIIDCLKTQTDPSKKALWAVLIIILPFIGSVLYLLVGKKQA